MEIIEPKILQGTRDFLPKEMAKRNLIMGKIVSTFSKFGYDAIETPSIEYSETILGKYGEEGSKLVYRFKDNGKRDICLRYDQTVPFARVVAMNYKNLPMPFKRYQIGRVWRADKPAKGRYREFYQCDIDIIGTQSLVAEAEIAKVIADVFANLGFPKIVIKFNSRRLINSILTGLDIPLAKQSDVIRILDKLEKLSLEKIKQELKSAISSSATEKLLALLKLGGSLEEKLSLLKNYNTTEITDFLKICKAFGVPNESLVFEPSLARGLEYYTGIIYEVYIPGLDIGAVCAGGRYDDL
jgi:histidyl-tRNA synthetase